jgi:hypothetical protein
VPIADEVIIPGIPAMWLPDWLYELLPYFYALAGSVTILCMQTPAGFGAGALLLLAALIILKMRSEYRNLKDTVRLAQRMMDFTHNTTD